MRTKRGLPYFFLAAFLAAFLAGAFFATFLAGFFVAMVILLQCQ
jgi:hypothetical protein